MPERATDRLAEPAVGEGADLTERLLEYDGKSVEPFRDVASALPKSPEAFESLVVLAASEEGALQVGATWVLKNFLESGAEAPLDLGEDVVRLMARVSETDAHLHLLQMLPLVGIPGGARRSLAARLEGLRSSKNAFVRAWALNGFAVLGLDSDAYRDRALALFEEVEREETAAVRARIRHARRLLGPDLRR